ncbi:hypothetical protein DPMN_082878 [Dreissena polymorpha]|uniref:Uncharacterized protein n=1 Tax=Dreissena polymorpha TaxID=45954 RepID=A0A9D3Y7P4_DREPO|nr:hypothetical protein DPMN_082872 [Dreissena polymorpha]KAH3695419.1 hypothetical protein DPMN_082878 [Dreissena polymorpha]
MDTAKPIQDNTKAALAASLIDLAATGVYSCRYFMCLPDLEKHKYHETGIEEDARRKEDAIMIITGGGCKEDNHRRWIITGGGCKEDNHRMRIITGGGCKEDNHRRMMQGG